MRQSMKQFYIRLVALAAALLFLLPAVPVARAASGECGDGVTWDLTGGVLTISGAGDMYDYRDDNQAPWSSYAASIRSVKVESGVTGVGEYAFHNLTELTAVSLADSVTRIGKHAFYNCVALTILDLGNGVQVLGEGAFERCESLMSVRLPESLTTIQLRAFYRCRSLQTICVPSSVVYMGVNVFGYCQSLHSAEVLAVVSELPAWMFYGCENLGSVTLSPAILETGVEAFKGCNMSEAPVRTSTMKEKVEHTIVTTDNQGVTTEQQFVSTQNSFVSTQTSEKKTTIEAIVENEKGWDEVVEQVQSANGDVVNVNIYLKGQEPIKGEQLDSYAKSDVALTIHTQQGMVWHIDTDNLDEVREKSYDLSFKLIPLTNPNEEQRAAVGTGTSFVLTFDADIDFKVELELPLGLSLARETAVFFSPEETGYTRMQAVVVDAEGIAHFYLGSVQAGTEYLIGINIPNTESNSEVSDAIIPEALKNEYPEMEQIEEIEYVVTGVKSSWGMDIKQVTWILVGVMGGSILVVGIVIAVMNKQRLKKGYMAELSDEEIAEIRASVRKKK